MNLKNDVIVDAQNLSKRVIWGDAYLDILTSVSLTIKKAETVAIVGASGSGKSTLLGLLAGLDLPSSGYVELAGHRLDDKSEDSRAQIRNRHVGFVFQSFQLLASFTALENTMLPLELNGSAQAAERARSALARVGLEHRLNHYPSQLSGGEQQRIALARAYVTHPGILFADEPTGNLDRQTGADVISLLFDLNRENGTTLVLVTHDEVLAQRCDRIVQLDSGALVT